ncbi:MAG: nucleotidyltransferase domain-containing protein [Ignavibacteriales bacterium]|nr:nucleotidyltransferase domain-containing protein [Ignavibacteriales bacterium]
MVIHHVLDEVFRSWSSVAVLRVLLHTTTGFTGNEVARASGMHPRSAIKALSLLEELGIVRRQRGGRDHLFTLNREHFLVNHALLDLYNSERQFPEVLMTTLSTVLKGSVLSAVLFGSVAKNEETPRSDLDICCIVKSEKQKDGVRQILDAEAPNLYKKFGVKLAPVVFTLDEVRRNARKPLMRDISRSGKVITGKDLKDLQIGKTQR